MRLAFVLTLRAITTITGIKGAVRQTLLEGSRAMQTLHKAFVSLFGTAVALLSGAGPVQVASAQEAGSGMTVEVPGDKQWQKNKDMPYGMRIMYLSGDPSKPGPYVYRVRVPTGYKIPPVKYQDERVTTILKGIMWLAEGERYDPMKMKELGAGTMFVTPADTPHYQWARTELILEVVGFGPIDKAVTYINPDDDPRTQ